MRPKLTGITGALVAGIAALALPVPMAVARPFNILLSHRSDAQPSIAQCEQQYGVACYNAAELERAVRSGQADLGGLTGRGNHIAVVDSFGSPTIQHDLAMFDAANGLPAPPSLEVIAPAGAIPAYSPFGADVGWAEETTLDVEMAHTIAPGASILVVETPVNETEGMTGFRADRDRRQLRGRQPHGGCDQPELRRHGADLPERIGAVRPRSDSRSRSDVRQRRGAGRHGPGRYR